jgi:hypothetical protein
MLSRVVVFGLFLLVARFPGFIPGAPAEPARLQTVVTQADAQWYLDIARNGYEVLPYEQSRQHNWAFYPGWPLLWRGAAGVTGEYPLTGMALATLLFLGALVVLHEVAAALGASEDVARRTVLYTALWPTSFFFSMCTTESLFLLLSAGTLLAGARGAWLAAGILGAFASATRPNGIVLAPVLGLLYWRQRGGRVRADALAILLVPAGVLALMARLHQATGNAFASFAIQVRWSKVPSFPLLPLWRWLKAPYVAEHWNFAALNFAAGVLGLWAAAHFARRRSWVLAAYALLGTLMPLSSRSLQGLLRYTMVLVPVPLALAEVSVPTARQEALLAVLAVLLGVMTMLGVGGYPFGLA